MQNALKDRGGEVVIFSRLSGLLSDQTPLQKVQPEKREGEEIRPGEGSRRGRGQDGRWGEEVKTDVGSVEQRDEAAECRQQVIERAALFLKRENSNRSYRQLDGLAKRRRPRV